jgi:hypothetical protein
MFDNFQILHILNLPPKSYMQEGLNFLNNERRTLRLIRGVTRASFELLLARLMNMHDVTADRSHSFYLITNTPTNHCIGSESFEDAKSPSGK